MNKGAWFKSRVMLCAILCVGVAASTVAAADKGMSLIGASRASKKDIAFAGETLLAAKGDVQFALLPFEFSPDKPFENATELGQQVLPSIKGRLEYGIYLKWFPHDASGNAEQAAFWKAWNADKPTSEQQRIRSQFMKRVAQANAWATSMRSWAEKKGLKKRLSITFIPVLEDTCPGSMKQAYRNILGAIADAQKESGMGVTRFRRSCLSTNIFRVSGAALEMHGRWSQVRDYLQSGDTWCNDGTHYDGTKNEDGSTYSIDQFISSQRTALKQGVNVIYWDGSYNGSPRDRDNWSRRKVNPFTGDAKTTERTTLVRVLTAS